MEVIIELIAALVMAIVSLFVLWLELLILLLAPLLEFVFMVIVYGNTAAVERFRSRRTSTEARIASRLRPRQPSASTQEVSADTSAFRQARWIIGGCFLLALAAFVSVRMLLGQRQEVERKSQIPRTNSQIESLADDFASRVRSGDGDHLKSTVLNETDVWETPLTLSVDRLLTGTLIIVRSCGPDAKSGTQDDQVATRLTAVPAGKFAAKKIDQGIDAVKNRIRKLLPGHQEKSELPTKAPDDTQ